MEDTREASFHLDLAEGSWDVVKCAQRLKVHREAGPQDPAGAGKGVSAGVQTPLRLVLKQRQAVSAGHTSKAD